MRALGHSGTMWTPQGSLAIGDDVEIDDAKALVRAEIRAHRRSRSSKLALDAGKAIAAHVKELLDGVEIVAAFASQPSEPDMTPILSALHEAGCEIRLPQLGPGLTRAWARYTPGDPLTEQAPARPPAPLALPPPPPALGRGVHPAPPPSPPGSPPPGRATPPAIPLRSRPPAARRHRSGPHCLKSPWRRPTSCSHRRSRWTPAGTASDRAGVGTTGRCSTSARPRRCMR